MEFFGVKWIFKSRTFKLVLPALVMLKNILGMSQESEYYRWFAYIYIKLWQRIFPFMQWDHMKKLQINMLALELCFCSYFSSVFSFLPFFFSHFIFYILLPVCLLFQSSVQLFLGSLSWFLTYFPNFPPLFLAIPYLFQIALFFMPDLWSWCPLQGKHYLKGTTVISHSLWGHSQMKKS